MRKGNQLHARRGRHVKTRQQTSTDQPKRKALVAVTDIVSAREEIVLIELVVDFENRAVHAVRKWSGNKCVVIRVPESDARAVNDRPRVSRQKFGNHGIHYPAIGGRRSLYLLGRWEP